MHIRVEIQVAGRLRLTWLTFGGMIIVELESRSRVQTETSCWFSIQSIDG